MIEDDYVNIWKDPKWKDPKRTQDQEDLENFWWCNEEEIREEEQGKIKGGKKK